MNLNKVDLNKLRTFLLVAEQEGITPAAARLGLTRSAVSQSVSALEASLGVSLFHRVGRRLTPTREARVLVDRLRQVRGQLQEVMDEIANEERAVRGLVRLGLYLGFSRLRLARLLERFTSRHPAARVKVLYAPHGELLAHLLGDRVDFVFSLSPLRQAGTTIRSRRLLRQELVLVGGSRFVRRPLTGEAIGRLPVIDYYQSDPLIGRWLRHHYGRRTPEPRVAVWAATTDLVLELLLDGAGVGVLPRDLAAPFVRARRLFVFDTGGRVLTDFVWVDALTPRYPQPLLEAFRAVLDEEFAPAAD